jgi:hypothetical protein
VVESGKHPANFAILAFSQNDFQNCGVATFVHNPGTSGTHFAFSQPDTFRQFLNDVVAGISSHSHTIGLFYTKFGVSQTLCQGAVVREQHQAFGVTVEPAHDEDAFLGFWNQILNQRSARWVAGCADVALGLIDQVVSTFFWLNFLAVDCDPNHFWIELGAEFVCYSTVNSHAALKHKEFASTSRADPSLSHDLL